jgi:hypothetical protein
LLITASSETLLKMVNIKIGIAIIAMIIEYITKYSIENLTLAFHENLQTLIYLLEDHKIIGKI